MISVAEADVILSKNLWHGGVEHLPLLATNNRILAQTVFADRDFPPFNRVTMDGIAIAHTAFANGQREFVIAWQQIAGEPVKSLPTNTACAEVMTGAILPLGTDTVVRYEDVRIENGKATITVDTVKAGQNVHQQGSDALRNDLLLTTGIKISAAEIPLLASVGLADVFVKSLPRTAIVSTGDELIDIEQTPQQHQIRKSNVYALAAALKQYGLEPNLFHLPDDATHMQTICQQIVSDYDLIILSGGVSKGKVDFVPTVLERCGIAKKFHQISQRPGKPMWFGVGANKFVFALPGNPVSTFLCCHRYVLPWLEKSLGVNAQIYQAVLNTDFTFDAPLTYFLQVKIEWHAGVRFAEPVPGGGSGDFVNLKTVDGFLELPPGKVYFKKGETYLFHGFR